MVVPSWTIWILTNYHPSVLTSWRTLGWGLSALSLNNFILSSGRHGMHPLGLQPAESSRPFLCLCGTRSVTQRGLCQDPTAISARNWAKDSDATKRLMGLPSGIHQGDQNKELCPWSLVSHTWS